MGEQEGIRCEGGARSHRASWVMVRMLPLNLRWEWRACDGFELRCDML